MATHYRTERDITALHKDVKYEKIRTIKEFESAYKDLESKIFVSKQDEKRRKWSKSFTYKGFFFEDSVNRKFKSLIESFMIVFNKDIRFEELKNRTYFKGEKEHSNLYKFHLNMEEKEFTSTYIENDTIYIDNFSVYQRGGKTYFKISKIMMLPITLDLLSQHTHTSKFLLNSRFKQYKNEIIQGLTNVI